jgi:ribosomal protein L35
MANSGKTNKALQRRFKVTRRGKLMHRPAGQDHFLAKKSGNKTRAGRGKKNYIFLSKTLRSAIN